MDVTSARPHHQKPRRGQLQKHAQSQQVGIASAGRPVQHRKRDQKHRGNDAAGNLSKQQAAQQAQKAEPRAPAEGYVRDIRQRHLVVKFAAPRSAICRETFSKIDHPFIGYSQIAVGLEPNQGKDRREGGAMIAAD
jgi:hypothetical protein